MDYGNSLSIASQVVPAADDQSLVLQCGPARKRRRQGGAKFLDIRHRRGSI